LLPVTALVVPTSKLPLESIRIDSAPPSVKAIVSAAGKKIPVLVSPVVVMAGSETVPAEKVVTPAKFAVVPTNNALAIPTPPAVMIDPVLVEVLSVVRLDVTPCANVILAVVVV
jgi:hypothetical protein